jgi:hypothetical protein
LNEMLIANKIPHVFPAKIIKFNKDEL